MGQWGVSIWQLQEADAICAESADAGDLRDNHKHEVQVYTCCKRTKKWNPIFENCCRICHTYLSHCCEHCVGHLAKLINDGFITAPPAGNCGRRQALKLKSLSDFDC